MNTVAGVDARQFDNLEALSVYIGDDEISQEANLNAYTRLFINGERVTKLYTANPQASHKNIENLTKISQKDWGSIAGRVVLPKKFVVYEGKIVGYSMMRVHGRPLRLVLEDPLVSFLEKMNYFQQIADVIAAFPEGVFAGDLHSDNVIVDDEGKICLIDADGFSVEDGYSLSCPMQYYARTSLETLPPRYFDRDGVLRISRSTDMFCLASMVLNFWLETRNFEELGYAQKRSYFSFLHRRGVPMCLLHEIWSIMYDEDAGYGLKKLNRMKSPPAPVAYEYFLRNTCWGIKEKFADRWLAKRLEKL